MAKPNNQRLIPFTNRASGVNWSSYSWGKGREFQSCQSVGYACLPKGFYPPSGGAVMEHLVNEVVHCFLLFKEALNPVPK